MDSSYVFANYSTWEERETQTQYLFQIFFLLYFAPMFALISTFSIFVNRWITLKKKMSICVCFSCSETLHSIVFKYHHDYLNWGFFFKMIVICYICCIQTGFIVNRVAFYILILIFFFFMFVKWLRWVRHIYS